MSPGVQVLSAREVKLLDEGAEKVFGGTMGEPCCYRRVNGMFVLFFQGTQHVIQLTREELSNIDSVIVGDLEGCPMLWVAGQAERGRLPLFTQRSEEGLRKAVKEMFQV